VSVLIPLSEVLRERARADHGSLEGERFMQNLMMGAGSRDDYIALVAQNYFIYRALEAAADSLRDDPIAAEFITPRLTRLPAIEADLRFLLGDDWLNRIAPLETTERYVDRIRTVAAIWPGGFIAHHYTRYLGDLSGGEVIRTVLQRRYGFETNGVGFYLFGEIAAPKEFKDTYRAQLDAVDWDDDERERVIGEVILAYRFNTELLDDLAATRSAA
jgi:heme oxygenase (biliverdin-producing, ferredoxin)